MRHNLYQQVQAAEVDYLTLISLLSHYAYPDLKISAMLKSGELVRVKKGLYVFGSDYTQTPYSLEILANLIYGPSAISLDYALSYYGLIPERVVIVTSITPNRDKLFVTPVGTFTYRYLNSKKFSIGTTLVPIDKKRLALIATPEKALADKVSLGTPGLTITNDSEAQEYLLEDLRIDLDELSNKISLDKLQAIVECYQNKNLTLIYHYLRSCNA